MKRGYSSSIDARSLTQPPDGTAPGASTLPEIIDAAIIRNVQPDDVLVLTVPNGTDARIAHEVATRAHDRIGCKVVVLTESVKLAQFRGDVL